MADTPKEKIADISKKNMNGTPSTKNNNKIPLKNKQPQPALHAIPQLSAAPQKKASASPQSAWGDVFSHIFSSATKEAEQLQGTAFAISYEGAENFRNFSESSLEGLNQLFSIQKDSFDTLVAICNTAIATCQSSQKLLATQYETALSEHTPACQDAFQCQTASDFMALQSKLFGNQINMATRTLSGLTELFVEFSNNTLEPVSQQFVDMSKKLSSCVTK